MNPRTKSRSEPIGAFRIDTKVWTRLRSPHHGQMAGPWARSTGPQKAKGTMNIKTRLDKLEQRSGDNHGRGVKWAGGPPPMTLEEWEYFCTLSDEEQITHRQAEGIKNEH